jgi:hypothetical protein
LASEAKVQLEPTQSEEVQSEANGFSSASYADRLMDDLFQDVEQLLYGESRRTDKSALSLSQPADLSSAPESEPERPPLETASNHSVAPVEEPSSSSALATLFPSWAVNQTIDQPALASEVAAIAAPDLLSSPQDGKGGSIYDRLLLAVGCVSILISLALWLFYQESRRPKIAASLPAAEVAVNAAPTPQNQFSDYAQKALQSIDQRSRQSGSTASTGVAPASGMPPVTIPQAVAPTTASNQAATGLNRVYVPVYQFPSNFKPPNSLAPLPTGTTPASPTPQYSTPARKPATTATSPITPGAPRRLAGVLELGDRSVALFEVNGVTQRYGIGESIGSSGWSLVEVSKDQAMIRRNGEVRSVFVGQSF